MKTRFLVMSLMLVLLSLFEGIFLPTVAQEPSNSVNETPKPAVINKFLQFILSASSGSISSSSMQDYYELKLSDVAPNVIYFTNRPRRITGTMTTRFFLKRWQKPPPHDFVANPPNAVIVYLDESKRQVNLVVELLKPQYQEKNQSLQFTIKPLHPDQKMPSTLDKPTLMMSEVTVCGLLGSWGNLPGEKQYDLECHAKANAKE